MPSDPSIEIPLTLTPNSYQSWRGVHLGSSGLVALLALAHATFSFFAYASWSADAAWFLGTGLGLLLLSTLNLSHIGVEPCQQPTTRLVRIANWVFVAFGVAAVVAVPMPQAFAVLAGLLGQAVAASRTLPGPA
ncbi:hypothetical protein BH24GEM2_BH24GEM2_07740 [soil metagenome]